MTRGVRRIFRELRRDLRAYPERSSDLLRKLWVIHRAYRVKRRLLHLVRGANRLFRGSWSHTSAYSLNVAEVSPRMQPAILGHAADFSGGERHGYSPVAGFDSVQPRSAGRASPRAGVAP